MTCRIEYVFPDDENDEVIRYLEHDEDSDLDSDGEDMDIDEGDRVWDADCK